MRTRFNVTSKHVFFQDVEKATIISWWQLTDWKGRLYIHYHCSPFISPSVGSRVTRRSWSFSHWGHVSKPLGDGRKSSCLAKYLRNRHEKDQRITSPPLTFSAGQLYQSLSSVIDIISGLSQGGWSSGCSRPGPSWTDCQNIDPRRTDWSAWYDDYRTTSERSKVIKGCNSAYISARYNEEA